MQKPHNQNNNQTNLGFTPTPVFVWFRKAKQILCGSIILHEQIDTSEIKNGRNFVKQKLVSGFTLIELLVVISIISLLSTVIFAVFSTSRVQAQDTAKKETVHSVQQALELYHSTYNKYPDNYTCSSADSCAVGRANPAVQGDTTNGGDWAYKKSMRELVTAKVMPSIPETSSGAGYAYYNDAVSGEAVFFTGLSGGYGSVITGQTFPSSAEFYAGDVAQELWPTNIRVTLQSGFDGISCGNISQTMSYEQGSNPPRYKKSGTTVMSRAYNTKASEDGVWTWWLDLIYQSNPCGGFWSMLRANPADNPLGYFFQTNPANGLPDENFGVAIVESLD